MILIDDLYLGLFLRFHIIIAFMVFFIIVKDLHSEFTFLMIIWLIHYSTWETKQDLDYVDVNIW